MKSVRKFMISNASLLKSHTISNASLVISEISGHITLGDFHYDQLQLSQFTKTDKKDTTLDLAKRLGLVTVDRQFPVDNLRWVFFY